MSRRVILIVMDGVGWENSLMLLIMGIKAVTHWETL